MEISVWEGTSELTGVDENNEGKKRGNGNKCAERGDNGNNHCVDREGQKEK